MFSVHLLFSVLLSLAISTRIQAALPHFSWDTLPVFFHSSNGSGLYTQDAIHAISRYSMVTVAQGQGRLVKTVDDEDAMVTFLRAVKKANPNTATYYYTTSTLSGMSWTLVAQHVSLRPIPTGPFVIRTGHLSRVLKIDMCLISLSWKCVSGYVTFV